MLPCVFLTNTFLLFGRLLSPLSVYFSANVSVRWDTNGWLISDDGDRGKVVCDVHHDGTLEKDFWVTGRESRTQRRSHRRTSTCEVSMRCGASLPASINT